MGLLICPRITPRPFVARRVSRPAYKDLVMLTNEELNEAIAEAMDDIGFDLFPSWLNGDDEDAIPEE